MAKFQSKKPDKVVAFEGGFITFKNGSYETTNKKEIEALGKAIGVEEVGGRKAPAPKKETQE